MTNRLFEADPPRNGEGNRSVKPNGGGDPPVLQARIKQVKRARRLRRTMSLEEVLLWQVLRKRPDGFRFRRQFPIRQMTADFACLERRLIIEVDGEGHSFGDQPRRDLARDAILRRKGFRVLRISAREVLKNLDGVIRYILAVCCENDPPGTGRWQTANAVRRLTEGPPPPLSFASRSPSPYRGGSGGFMTNKLYYGDNLDVLRNEIASESVDLVYLDPPFNSNANYNILFKSKTGDGADAQIEAFEDTWHWNDHAEDAFDQVIRSGNTDAAELLRAMRQFLGENDMMAYLAMMAIRLIELHRVLKPTGSLYLHCDPTASHYLKLLLDAVFGPANYRTEISWKRSSAHNDAKQGRSQYGNIRDVIYFYTKSDKWIWNWLYTTYDESYLSSAYRHIDSDGRRYRRGDLTAAKPGGDVSYGWPVRRPIGGAWEADLEKNSKIRKKVGNTNRCLRILAASGPSQRQTWLSSPSKGAWPTRLRACRSTSATWTNNRAFRSRTIGTTFPRSLAMKGLATPPKSRCRC